jgi:serine/threonine-protein kinase
VAVLADKSIADALDRILGSQTFQQAGGLKRFLRFIVNETIAGRVSELKEYVIGVQVFRTDQSFDPRTDPIVRVQARRLRAKLVQYYTDEGRHDTLTIEIPKGGYAPVFKRREAPIPAKRTVGAVLLSRNTVAVLPLEDFSPDGDLGYFCKGLREEILHRLARLRGLRILAANGSDTAALVISGGVRRAGPRIRISVHVIDGASACYLWSEAIDADLADGFVAQERVAEAIVSRLEPELREDGKARKGLDRPAENLAAKNLYLQGRYHLNQRSEEGLRKSVEFFERALAEDPDYALAHSGLADAYGLLGHYGVLGPAEVWTKAASRGASAVMLDDLSAEAHTSLAHVKATQDWDWASAEREYQRAISLNPGYPTAHHWYAVSCLAPLGRLDEALNEMLIAQSLDPVSSIVARDLAVIHFYRRDFETALEQCDHTIELNPHFAPGYWILGVIQEQRRDFDESAAAFQRAVHLSPQTPRMHGALGRTFALSGRTELAREILRKLEAYAGERYVSPLEFAWIHFALGDIDLGFHWLAKAGNDRSFDLISLKVDPRFDALRDDARFTPLLKQLGV